jgi:hypothetical protein
MTLPLFGLALDRRPPESVVPLLVAMYRWSVPATLDPAAGEPAAILATAESVGRVPKGVPMALWTRSAEELTSKAGERAAAIVSDDLGVVERAGERGVLAATGNHARGRRPMSPFVRERLRRARGLPEVAILEQTDDGWRWCERPEPLDDELVGPAMACASAVACTEQPRLLEALAWAAPVVSDRAAAKPIGAAGETHLLLGGTPRKRLELARRLSSDPELASRLSWAGRRLVERRHDSAWAAIRLAELLGLRPSLPEGASARATLRMSELGTPTDAKIATRFAEATTRVAVTKVR